MAALDQLFRTMASAMTKALGPTCSMKRRVTTYVQNTDEETVATTTLLAVPCTPPEPFEGFRVDGANILASDLKVCIPAADLRIDDVETLPSPTGWELTFAGTAYKVFRVRPYYSGDQAALLELQLRK